jgi:diguanylate cyclase
MKNPMNSNDPRLAWAHILSMMAPAGRAAVRATVHRHADSLAHHFYSAALTEPEASRMLDHTIVNQRLHASLVRWMKDLFDEDASVETLLASQRIAGEMHARIGVPIQWVTNGARVLKRAMAHHLVTELPPDAPRAEAVQFVYELVDMAVDSMNSAATTHATRMTRSDEGYRLFFLTQNLQAERERQKSQLMEWAHQILVRNYWGMAADEAPGGVRAEGASPFELWLKHKASVLFEHSPELPQIQALIDRIEDELLPRLITARASGDDARDLVATIHQQIDAIKQLLGSMFDQVTEHDNGRDGVTHLLNRRYFPSVVKREIAIAQDQHSCFALLMLELDRFASVGQTLGMAAADLVLAQVAEALSDSVRAGDFVFRVGDHQFLLLLADAAEASVRPIAEGLRHRVASLSPRLPGGATTTLTASIGVAVHDGHPDYQRLLARAESALRQAQEGGCDQVVVAAPTTEGASG